MSDLHSKTINEYNYTGDLYIDQQIMWLMLSKSNNTTLLDNVQKNEVVRHVNKEDIMKNINTFQDKLNIVRLKEYSYNESIKEHIKEWIEWSDVFLNNAFSTIEYHIEIKIDLLNSKGMMNSYHEYYLKSISDQDIDIIQQLSTTIFDDIYYFNKKKI